MKVPEDLTKEQLIKDLTELRSRINEFERSEENRRKHQEELNRAKAMFEGLFEFAPDAIIVAGRGGEIVRVNKQAEKLFGYSRNELLNLHLEVLVPERFREIHGEHRRKYMSEPHIRPMGTGLELCGRRKNGSEFSVDIALGPLKAGDDIVVMAVIRDVSDRKRTEEELRRTQTLLSEAEKLSHSGAWEWDLATNQWTFSDEWLRIHGSRKRTLAPEEVLPIVHPDDRAAIEQAFDDVRKGVMPYDIEHRIIRQDTGEVRIVKARGRYVRDAAGTVVRVYGFAQDITERKQAEDALKLTRFSVDHASVSAFLIGKDARILYVNDQACRSLGYSQKELLATTIPDLDPNVPMSAWNDIWARLKKKGSWRFESLHRRKDGTLIPVEISANYVSFGGREYDWAYSVDISERKQAEKALRESENRYRTLFSAIDEGFCIVEVIFDENEKPIDYRFLETNQSFEKQTGLIDAQGKRMRELAPKHEYYWFEIYGKIALTGQPARFQKRAEQLHRWYDVYAFRFGQPENRQVAILFNDITERKKMEEEIKHMAHHDALTGMPNRRLFRDIAELELAQARRNRRKLAILFLDLDRFKEINDTLGHDVGDELLKQAAGLFRETVRASDTVARIGGDEFNIILADIVRPEDVSDIAQKIIKRFRSPFSISGHELNVTTSIGISVYPDDSTEIDTLLRYADIAMYHAKESGRNTFRFYNPAINVRSIERMQLENMLRRSIDMGELVIYYQPQIDIQNKRMMCAEALIRWQHPEKGFLTPDRFLAQAEETGFITEIDEWALKTACAQVRSWIDSDLSPVCVTVNLSARQFEKPDLVDRISAILKETGMEPGCLDLEVTESTAMRNIERTASHLRELRKMGVHISIDDFGTGYSSLNYLKKLPIERLKIDKSFIQDIANDPDDRAIISAVTSMAHKMGIKTVAEGVETEEQLAFVKEAGCDEAQGYLFSRPVPAEKFRELVSPR